MRVMSFNLRYDNEADGKYNWQNRLPAVIEVLKETNPDVLGIQEGLPHQINDLKNILSSYRYFGRGRTQDEASEQIGIFYKNGILDVRNKGHFWLSKTPHKIGSKDFGSDLPRMTNWIYATHIDSKKKLFILNTHYDNKSMVARNKASQIIIDKISKFPFKIDFLILVGDFNNIISNRPINILKDDLNLLDALKEVGNTEPTFHDFSEVGIMRIDYILCSKMIGIKKGKVIKLKPKNIYPSDHYPIYADLGF